MHIGAGAAWRQDDAATRVATEAGTTGDADVPPERGAAIVAASVTSPFDGKDSPVRSKQSPALQ